MLRSVTSSFLLLLLLNACGDPNKGNPNFAKVDADKAQNYRMDRWNFLMKIPKGYTTVLPEELIEDLTNADLPQEIIESEIRQVYNYFSLNPDVQLLLSINHPENQILIQGEDLPLRINSKEIQKYGQQLVDSYFENQPSVVNLEVVENKFIINTWFKYSKFKVRYQEHGETAYACHYLVTSNEHSFWLLYHSASAEDDLQEYINALEYVPN